MATREEALYNAVMNDQAKYLRDASTTGDIIEEVYEFKGTSFSIEVVGTDRVVPPHFPGQIRTF